MSTSPFVLLPSSHARANDKFTARQSLKSSFAVPFVASAFRRLLRALYATDASNYRHIPIGLVVPLDEQDDRVDVGICRSFGAPLLSAERAQALPGRV